MRRSTLLSFAVLLPVVYLTWVVSSGLMAQQLKKAARPALVRVADTPTGQLPIDDSTRIPVQMTYEYKAKRFEVQVTGNRVGVSSSIEMLDRKGDRTYLWRLRSFKKGIAEPAVDIPYPEQMFAIDPLKKTLSPDFADSILLPQGTHRIVLTLHGVPMGYDMEQLGDPAEAEKATLLKFSRTIEIQ